jgi:hypothetical protein
MKKINIASSMMTLFVWNQNNATVQLLQKYCIGKDDAHDLKAYYIS